MSKLTSDFSLASRVPLLALMRKERTAFSTSFQKRKEPPTVADIRAKKDKSTNTSSSTSPLPPCRRRRLPDTIPTAGGANSYTVTSKTTMPQGAICNKAKNRKRLAREEETRPTHPLHMLALSCDMVSEGRRRGMEILTSLNSPRIHLANGIFESKS